MIPEWLKKETFAVQHNPNCPSPYLVRLIGKGAGLLDLKPYFLLGKPKPGELTRDALGFGKTLEEAAEAADRERKRQKTPNVEFRGTAKRSFDGSPGTQGYASEDDK